MSFASERKIGAIRKVRICDGWRVRRLTPVECERLQGVPDRYTHILMKRRQRARLSHDMEEYWSAQHEGVFSKDDLLYLASDSPRYRVLGNSFSVNKIRWVGWGIKIVDRILFG